MLTVRIYLLSLKNNVKAKSNVQRTTLLISRYNFRLLDTSGWNFRHAHYHGEASLQTSNDLQFEVPFRKLLAI